MTLPSVQSALLTDRVYDALMAAIVSGDLVAGARLRVRDIAAEVGTSVIPVQQAIARLEEAGFAEREPHKGAVVKGLTYADLVHVYDVRLVLECEATRLGAPGMTTESRKTMASLLKRMDAAVASGDVTGALDLDEDLLSVLYDASCNPVLTDMIRTLWRKCRAYKVIGAKRAIETGDHSLWDFQPRLVDAVARRDHAEALEITATSVSAARERVRLLLVDGADSDAHTK
ncbi:GntR family transcriptional regulator [Rhodococcus sp. G-MC3]|uniref:GntR family transcriptional regulator n=1 Tax=Rhodococcus sp. G-MC3 TaxID=3046209 RepID=UPI0024BBB228|nr:GntR family transcriptional regulator [Rhodococcus sp. G-MC3]MDJ0396446.1 GntR family transcriptional regulator [Rhodococcus sp. G-MC3]